MAVTVRCNICGKRFDEWDHREGFKIEQFCGYGTKFDGEYLRIDICCKCLEKLADSCTVSPFDESAVNVESEEEERECRNPEASNRR